MKLLATLLLTLTMTATAQDWAGIAKRSALVAVAGFADGTAETLRVHYTEFKEVHPNANDKYWNPAVSWPNKYAEGLQPYHSRWYHFGVHPAYKERFAYSTTVFSWTTDGYHLLRTTRNTLLVVAIAIPIGHKKSFKNYAIEAVSYMTAYGLGFTLAYDLIY
jgi:hypothetical protein